MNRYRLGCVPYLNARPLVDFFETGAGVDLAEVVYAPPSALAEMLDRDEVDAALASSFYSLSSPNARVASAAAISSQGDVQSVRLFSRVQIPQIRSLALDRSSLTSNSLVLGWLSEVHGIHPATDVEDPDISRMLERHDACVLIGDVGMNADETGKVVVDLGRAWAEWKQLPFVWAMWTGREGLTEELNDCLRLAIEFGLANLRDIAERESSRTNQDVERAYSYLKNSIDFTFSSQHLVGLREFSKECAKLDLLDEDRMPTVVGAAVPA